MLHDFSLQVKRGDIFALLGPNGAGKSTTVALLTGLLRADSGTVTILGHHMHPEALEVRRLLGVVPDGLALFEYLSIWDNLQIIREAWGLDARTFEERAKDLLHLLDLTRDVGKQVRHCSYGMRKKIALAMALLPNPKVLILDEPFEGLDPIMAKAVEVSLRNAAARGLTVLITTHMLASMNGLLTQYGILRGGKLVASGDFNELRREGITLQEAYVREFEQDQEQGLPWLG